MRRGPLAGVYPAAAGMVVLFLVPYLALSSALGPLQSIIGRQLHMSAQRISLSFGMANAGYAVGTVLAVVLAQHLPQRRMMVLYSTLLVAGSVMAAAATTPSVFIVGHVMQGLCTSMLLIASLPPLIVGQPVSKLRPTAMILNMAIFGAVALGPLLGGVAASSHAWRPLFWAIAGVASVGLLLALLTFEDAPPADRSAPVSVPVVFMATGGSVAAFYGASELTSHPFVAWVTLAPLIGGALLIVALIVHQYRAENPLLNVRGLATTIPVSGTIVAMAAAAASVSAVELVSIALSHRYSPAHVGLYLLPEFAGAAITAVLLGLLQRRRAIHYLVLGGMIALAAGILIISRSVPASEGITLAGSGLIGLGVGGAVAPALLLTGFSVAASNLQRVFALVELLRGVAAFMVAPILVHVAFTVGGTPTSGTSTALWVCFGIATGGALIAVTLYLLGRVRPQAPDLDAWFTSQRPGAPGGPVAALQSPPLLAALRPRHAAKQDQTGAPDPPASHNSASTPTGLSTPHRVTVTRREPQRPRSRSGPWHKSRDDRAAARTAKKETEK